MEFLGHLELRDGGACTELISNCRSLAYLSKLACRSPWFVEDCEDCCCDIIDLGYGTSPADGPNVAPWYQATIPASAEFLGLYGHLTMTRVSADGISTDRITFTGIVLATSIRGSNYGCQWVNRSVEPYCQNCRGIQATVYAHCGENPDSVVEAIPESPRPDPKIGLDLCDTEEPPILGTAPAATPFADSGARQLLNVNYVDDSFTVLEDLNIPGCFGKRVTFSFDVNNTFSYTDPFPVCEFGPGAEDPDSAEEPFNPPCRPLGVTNAAPVENDCGRCGRPCYCDTNEQLETTEDTVSPGALSDLAHACQWSKPLCSKRWTCVTPPIPWDEGVPTIRIDAGSAPLENVMVTFWDAHPGLPDPGTHVGAGIYENRSPIESPIQLHVPQTASIDIDGRSGQATLNCDGTRGAGSLAGSCDGGAPTVPTVRCGRRIWIVIDIDCANESPDWKAKVEIAGRERLS